ncbi:MAG: type II toxin-antitoxin system RelE/ParE family toxin [Patescibacteria group bacterium]
MQIFFFHKDIKAFVKTLEISTQAKVERIIDLLEEFDQNLGMPHSKHVISGVFELRIRGIQEVRLFYTFHKDSIVFLHGYIKKSQKIPSRALRVAIKRKADLDHT